MHGHLITEARHRLDTAVTGHGDELARARVLSQIELASLVMVTGDPDEAAMIGGQALDAAATIRSRRAADDMHDLSRLGEPHTRLAEVAELIHRIGSAVASSEPDDTMTVCIRPVPPRDRTRRVAGRARRPPSPSPATGSPNAYR